MTRRLAIDAGSDFPALFQIKTRRLKMDGRQHRTRAELEGSDWFHLAAPPTDLEGFTATSHVVARCDRIASVLSGVTC
jgi:hypothetical protein